MKHCCLLIFFAVGSVLTLWSQGCYTTFLDQGIVNYNDLQYDAAIDNFKAAIICSDRPTDLGEVTDWLEKAQNGFFDEIQRQKQRVEAALLVAEQEKAAADSARLIAEANRFGLLARNALEVGNDTNALILSYAALQLLSGMAVPGSLDNAFGQSGHEFFSESRRSEEAPIFSMLAISDPPAVLFESGKGAISLLSLETMEVRTIGRHDNYLTNLRYDAKFKKLLSTDIDGNIQVWDLNTYQSTAYPAHEREVTAAAFAPENGVFLTVSKDKSSKLWNLSGQLKEQLPVQAGIPYAIEMASTGQFLMRSIGGELTVWNAEGQKLAELSNLKGFIYDAQFSPDGRMILTASGDKTARIWDLEGQEVASLTHNSAVRSAGFSPNGELILTRTKNDEVKIWNRRGQLIKAVDTRQQGLTLAAFSPSGNFIVTGAKDHTVKVWSSSGALLHTLAHERVPIGVHFSPDEQLILTTAKGSSSKLWDHSGNLLRTIALRAANDIPSVFSTDGRYILSVIDDRTINVCPIPEVTKDMIEKQTLLESVVIDRVEEAYGIKLRGLWPR